MTTISLCMIVKNEEKNIARCLDSVAELVEEIIIVDNGPDGGNSVRLYVEGLFISMEG